MYYLGIDSGGTKAAFLLADEKGRVYARCRLPGCTVQGGRREGIRRMLETGITEILRLAGMEKEDIAFLGLGISGYGEGGGSEQETQKACDEAFIPGRSVCSLDAYIAWAGSLLFRPGVNIIAGTGSVITGYTQDGRMSRAGGWGAGCDEGSCSWIGRRVVEAYTKQADGRAERTPLYQLFRKRFQFEGEDVKNIYRLSREVVRDGKGLAELQLLLVEAWKAGDPAAREIYGMAADELVLGVETVARKLGMEHLAFPVSYSGGLFKAGPCILEPLREKLDSRGRVLTEPVYEPDVGAVLTAICRAVPDYDVNQFALREE